MEGTQKRESNYYFLIKVLPKECLKISQKSHFNFQSKGQRHLNFHSKSVLFEKKNTNTTVNISITLFLSWDNYDDFPTLWLVPSLFGPSWQHVSRPASSSLSYLRTSEVQMRRIIFQYLWWYPWVRVAEDKRSWELLRFLLHFAFCCRLIIISRGILLIFYFSYE